MQDFDTFYKQIEIEKYYLDFDPPMVYNFVGDDLNHHPDEDKILNKLFIGEYRLVFDLCFEKKLFDFDVNTVSFRFTNPTSRDLLLQINKFNKSFSHKDEKNNTIGGLCDYRFIEGIEIIDNISSKDIFFHFGS